MTGREQTQRDAENRQMMKKPDFGPEEVIVNDVRYCRETTLFAALERVDELKGELEQAEDRERRERELVADLHEVEGTVPSQWYLDMKHRAEQAESERDERITRDDSDRLLAQRDQARTAYNSLYRKIDDLTSQLDTAQEALRKIIALPVPRAVEAIEIADEALS